jgi:predicted nucleic acid-binding protein
MDQAEHFKLSYSLFLQQEAASGAQQQQHTGGSGLGELSQSDLTGLVSSLDEDTEEDLFKQLGESTFELDNFFTDFEDKASAAHMRTEGT